MSDYDDLKPLWLEAHQSARDHLILQARLGRGDAAKTLFVSNKPGYCWARIYAPEGVTQKMIRCRKVTAAYGAMVDVQRGRDGVYEAIGESSTDAAQAYWGDLGNGNVPRHGAAHSLNGVDPVFLSVRQYKPLCTIPDTPASTSVYVNPAWYIDTSGVRQYFAGSTADLSSEIAALLPDEQQLVVIALDRSTGTLTKIAGAAQNISVSNIYGMPFAVADVTGIALADNLIPSQAVRIREAQTTIQLYDMPEAFDMRVWHGGQLHTGALTIEDALFTLQDDGDNTKQLQFQLSGITAGQTRTLTVPDLSDMIVTLTATQTLTNKTLTSPTINTPVIVGGTINGAIIGGTTPAAGTFTTLQSNTSLLAIAGSAATVPLKVRGTAAQTGNLQEWQNTSGGILASVEPASGYATFGANTVDAHSAVRAVSSFANPSATKRALRGFQSIVFTSAGALQHMALTADGSYSAASGITQSGALFGNLATVGITAAHAGTISVVNIQEPFFSVSAGAAGTVSAVRGLLTGFSFGNPNTTAIGSLAGIQLGAVTNLNGGSITNLYGLLIENQSAGTDSYAIVTSAGKIVFNEGGDANTDVRIEGDTDANLFLTDASVDAAGIGCAAGSIVGKFHVDQSSTTGAKPVLTLDQADVSEEIMRLIGSSANGVLTQTLVEAADVASATLAGYLKVYIQDDGNQIADGAYFIPFYTSLA